MSRDSNSTFPVVVLDFVACTTLMVQELYDFRLNPPLYLVVLEVDGPADSVAERLCGILKQ